MGKKLGSCPSVFHEVHDVICVTLHQPMSHAKAVVFEGYFLNRTSIRNENTDLLQAHSAPARTSFPRNLVRAGHSKLRLSGLIVPK